MTTGTMGGYDASSAPGKPPQGDQVVMGYGGGDTPHVWSLADWDSQPARFRIPIWTRSNPGGHDGAAEAHQFLAYLDSVGAPRGILTVVDYETAIDADYINAFDAVMFAAGNRVALYGSKSTLFQNPIPSGGYFPADLTGTSHLYPGTLLTQYAFEQAWDDDTVSAAAVLWDTQPAAPTPSPQGEIMPTFAAGEIKAGFTVNQAGQVDASQATVVVVPPSGGGALKWGAAWLSLGCDFAGVQLRVALKVDGKPGWQVSEHTIAPGDDRYSIPLPTGTGKISIGRVAQSATDSPATPCGWMVEQGA